MSTNYQLDEIDRKILSHLVKNARMPFLEIARNCGVSGAAIHQRVKKMENMGIVTGSRLLVKPQAFGLQVCAIVGVSLSETNDYRQVIENLRAIPEVVECHYVTGKYALMLKVYCLDHDDLMRILVDTIQKIPCVVQTETLISLDHTIDRNIDLEHISNIQHDK